MANLDREIWRNYKWLYDHYHQKGMSYAQIAEIVGVSKRSIIIAARKFGIESRTSAESLSYKYDKDIYKMYIELEMPIAEIAKSLGISGTAVRNSLVRQNIPRRTRSQSRIARLENDGRISKDIWANHDWLSKAYKTKSINEICRDIGWPYGTVVETMNQCGVKRRRNSDALKKIGYKISKRMKYQWRSDDYKNLMARHRSNQSKVSNIQETLYSILDDLGAHYYREHNDHIDDKECSIGPYNFDCVIPRPGKRTLLIECNGDYWHKLPRHARNDKAKKTYINKYFPGQYELKTIWEHEFSQYHRIVEMLKYWLGINTESCEFDFNDIQLSRAKPQDYRDLLSKYHYLANAGRGGIAYGAYLDSQLIAVCVFSPMVRQNIADNKTTRELSRLCIHPRYQKKNFASWFVGRCIKLLPKQYNKIISYCDATFNHNGTVYKACNFKLDGEVRPDYWYVNQEGWVMHKKTLYNHARKMQLTEEAYANKMKYKKVWGQKKLRFVLLRN